jgi:hypothetical protein
LRLAGRRGGTGGGGCRSHYAWVRAGISWPLRAAGPGSRTAMAPMTDCPPGSVGLAGGAAPALRGRGSGTAGPARGGRRGGVSVAPLPRCGPEVAWTRPPSAPRSRGRWVSV